jgi:hypothetical protein
MALCLNPSCQRKVPSNTTKCSFCGGAQISEFNTYTKAESLNEEVSMENFYKVAKFTEPFIEKTIVPKDSQISMKSKIAVRFQYIRRKLFSRR